MRFLEMHTATKVHMRLYERPKVKVSAMEERASSSSMDLAAR